MKLVGVIKIVASESISSWSCAAVDEDVTVDWHWNWWGLEKTFYKLLPFQQNPYRPEELKDNCFICWLLNQHVKRWVRLFAGASFLQWIRLYEKWVRLLYTSESPSVALKTRLHTGASLTFHRALFFAETCWSFARLFNVNLLNIFVALPYQILASIPLFSRN